MKKKIMFFLFSLSGGGAERTVVKIPREKFYVKMQDIGNTVSASIPIALKRAEEKVDCIKEIKFCSLALG